MLFPTIDFALFFAVAYVVNWKLNPYPVPWKLAMLAFSYFFYAWWDWRFVLLLAASTAIAGVGGALCARLENPRARRAAMVGSVAGLLGLLGYFKYYGFVSSNLDNLLHSMGLGRLLPVVQPTVPVAVSFFTFMAISYVVDISRGQLEEARPIDLAVYLSFFPHLIAGPIVRGGELLPQIRRRRRDPSEIDYGRAFWLIAAGLFKKVVISTDMAAWIVNPVFASPSAHSGPEVLFAAWGYAVQIYCDFSGYTDMAIGVALLLGFRFPVNFDRPYTARSLQDFWRRWHITLSRWLRDYLYIPLGGNQGSKWRVVRNIVITMVLGGLWHGAAWTFVCWGLLHGVGQGVSHLRREHAKRRESQHPSTPSVRRLSGGVDGRGEWVPAGPAEGGAGALLVGTPALVSAARGTEGASAVRRCWQRFWTFQFVCLGWVFFNASSFANATALLGRLTTGWSPSASPLVTPLLVLTIVGVLAVQFIPPAISSQARDLFNRQRTGVQAGVLAVVLLGVTTLGPSGVAPFIYYRF